MKGRKLYRIWVTTSPAVLVELEEMEQGPRPDRSSVMPRVCWTLAAAGHDAVGMYGERDTLTASGRYTATKIEIVEIADNGKGAR